jgi:MFS family permease
MAVLIVLISLFRVLGSIIGPAWGSLMSEYLPEGQRVQYLGWRSRMVAISGIISTAFWGTLLHFLGTLSQNAGFVAIFAGVVFTRFLSFSFMARMKDLPFKQNGGTIVLNFSNFRERLKNSNFARFVYFVTTMTFATQLAAPYFSVYMLRDLQFGYLSYTSVQLASVVAGMVAFPLWGRNADIVGNARVLKSTAVLIPFLPLLWMLTTSPVVLVVIELFSGFVWSGFTLCTSNFIYDAVAPEKRVRYLGYFNRSTAEQPLPARPWAGTWRPPSPRSWAALCLRSSSCLRSCASPQPCSYPPCSGRSGKRQRRSRACSSTSAWSGSGRSSARPSNPRSTRPSARRARIFTSRLRSNEKTAGPFGLAALSLQIERSAVEAQVRIPVEVIVALYFWE